VPPCRSIAPRTRQFYPALTISSFLMLSSISSRHDGGDVGCSSPHPQSHELDPECAILEKKVVVSPEIELKDEDIDFPDGGLRAWLVVAGVCIISSGSGRSSSYPGISSPLLHRPSARH
jgi:hypothetical protein